MTKKIEAGASFLTLSDVAAVARDGAAVALHPMVIRRVEKSRAVVERYVSEKKIMYGITTGFGKLADALIEPEKNKELQRNLLLSHAVGVGEPFPDDVARAMLFLRLHSLARGYSGVRPVVLEYLIHFLNQGITPIVPSQGSVGASGDLAPLAHLALPLIGEGEVTYREKRIPGGAALAAVQLKPLALEAKEGIGLINGTQAMTAAGALALHDASRVLQAASIAAAMTLEATLSSDTFLDEKLHAVRPHPGQASTAKEMRGLVAGSGLVASHKESLHRVQDGYSIRCSPQVHGPVQEAYDYVRSVLETELNSITDNPLVFPAISESVQPKDEVISGGNFHGHPVSLALDFFKIALAGLANISERRIERLVNPALSGGLPAFLSPDPGIHSGMMICQYTAAALVSENKSLSHPASVDSIPTSANQEDFNSMGTIASRQLAKITANAATVLGIELLCAAQALDFRRPLKFGRGVEKAHAAVRAKIAPLEADRIMKDDIESAVSLILSGELARRVYG